MYKQVETDERYYLENEALEVLRTLPLLEKPDRALVTLTEEIQNLGKMLTATTETDLVLLKSIISCLREIEDKIETKFLGRWYEHE